MGVGALQLAREEFERAQLSQQFLQWMAKENND